MAKKKQQPEQMQTDFTDPNQLSPADDLNEVFKEEVVEQVEEQVQEVTETAVEEQAEESVSEEQVQEQMNLDELPEGMKPGAFRFPEDLVATLEKYPHIHSVWMNESGEWHFAEKPGYTAIAREEILNG